MCAVSLKSFASKFHVHNPNVQTAVNCIKAPRGVSPNIWKLLAQSDKDRLMQTEANSDDLNAACEADLHDGFYKQLAWRNIFPIHSAMDRKTTNAVGTPDFLFAMPLKGLPLGVPVAVEFKWKKNDLTPDQRAAIAIMNANGWRVSVARSISEALAFLKQVEEECCSQVHAPVARMETA